MNTIEDRSIVNLDSYTRQIEDKKETDNNNKAVGKKELTGDRVDFSNHANQVLKAKKLIDSLPATRNQKIAEIKRQIEAGTYQIRAKETASNLLRESLINDRLI